MNIRLVCGWECLSSERHFKFKTLLVGHSYYPQMCPTINVGHTEFLDFLLAYTHPKCKSWGIIEKIRIFDISDSELI